MRYPIAFLACLWLASAPAPAAESQAGCAGFIDAAPKTIGTQGVWCLRQDLSHSGEYSAAININANNVTIDCNGFRIEGLASASDSFAAGIRADGQENITVRNCGVRGFLWGIRIVGGSGHLVEDNVLDHNFRNGIDFHESAGAVVRRNRVLDTGAGQNNDSRRGIRVSGVDGAVFEVRDNIVGGVRGTSQYFNGVQGISLYSASSATVTGNRVAGLVPNGTDRSAVGIALGTVDRAFVFDNEVGVASPVADSIGISCSQGEAALRGNSARGFETAFSACFDDGGNAAR